MEKMDNNTKNILYPKGSIFRMLESDVISSELEIARGAIVEAVSDIEVDDEYAEVCCNGETFIVGTDIMGIIPVKVSRENKSVKNDIIDDKLRWDLLPMEEIEDIVKVYHAGAKKYGPNKRVIEPLLKSRGFVKDRKNKKRIVYSLTMLR